ncbi:Protein SHQ1 [Orchesella cincta]|uniref:Protein SHQ1 homolog n=1 Tax=Orchesella cincta TaxID=48709 RepID=A0A1D2MHG2_ORCCI|nr:Protein SHQ1 [Orchesella cincta]
MLLWTNIVETELGRECAAENVLFVGEIMITPKFELSQTETHLIIHVWAPYTSVKDTEIEVVEEEVVIFASSPYYLRLTLPGRVEETGESSADYNADDGKYTISLNKVVPGTHFPNLEMLTTLLLPKNQKKRVKPLIEVIGEDGVKENSTTVDFISEDDWFIEQTPMEEDSPASACSSLLNKHSYGFLSSHSGLQDKYVEELAQVSEIRNPDSCSEAQRRSLRLEKERVDFSDEHYLADLMENEEVGSSLQFKFDLSSLKELSEKNKEKMKDLGNREFLVDKVGLKKSFLGLVDILYAYCYDWRITEGAHCCESPWNIARLSGTLSWFDSFDSVRDVVHCCMRRSLVYPLSRHWLLSRKVMTDVVKVLKSGPVAILICFLDILDIFGKKEPYYLLNQLYIEEYCVWIQQIGKDSTNLTSIVVALEKAFPNYKKEHVGFDLEELEAAAAACEEEEAMEEEISDYVRNVAIH